MNVGKRSDHRNDDDSDCYYWIDFDFLVGGRRWY